MAIFNMVWGGGGGSIPNYLCFTANTAGSTVKLQKNWTPYEVELEISVDWINWSTYTIWNTITLSNLLDKIYFRNKSKTDTNFSKDSSNYYKFVMTWSIAWSWDINYLLNKNSTNTLLSNECYRNLFNWCSSLISSPELSATTLSDFCYASMFRQCTGLISMPKLSATTLAKYCCYYMFYDCTSLVDISEFKATNLAESCYFSMFNGCKNLEKIPKLPATTLVNQCYASMFGWCSKIKLSTTKTWAYQTAYRVPITWTWTGATNALDGMFGYTWGTFTWTPTINTTYYTSNTVV